MEAKRALAEIFAGAENHRGLRPDRVDRRGHDGARRERVRARGDVGRMNPYVVVAVARADGALAAPGEEGEVVIGGPTVMAGYYRDAPRRRRRSATAGSAPATWDGATTTATSSSRDA